MYICIYVNKYTYMYLYITYMYLYIRVWICIYMYVSCMYVCIRVCANTHILACVRRCKRAYRWSGSATGRGLSLSSSICIYVHIDKGVYMRTYVYIVRVCVYMDMFIYVCMYIYVCVRACIRACTYAHVCICVVVDVCVDRYVCMCGLFVHTHVRIYVHVGMHAPRPTT
jgi:hypothetical protein